MENCQKRVQIEEAGVLHCFDVFPVLISSRQMSSSCFSLVDLLFQPVSREHSPSESWYLQVYWTVVVCICLMYVLLYTSD